MTPDRPISGQAVGHQMGQNMMNWPWTNTVSPEQANDIRASPGGFENVVSLGSASAVQLSQGGVPILCELVRKRPFEARA